MTGNLSHREVAIAGLLRRFEKPRIENHLRAIYVEHLVEVIIGAGWVYTGADWGRCDFTSKDGRIRLEVKQSAALQSWPQPRPQATATPFAVDALPRFDVRPRAGWFDGATWHPEAGRGAHVYLFAWHPVTDLELVDHLDETQWEFYVLSEKSLPPSQKSIGLASIRKLGAVRADHLSLRAAIDDVVAALSPSAGRLRSSVDEVPDDPAEGRP